MVSVVLHLAFFTGNQSKVERHLSSNVAKATALVKLL